MAGKLLVAQSGGPTAVLNATLAGIMSRACNNSNFDAVYGSLYGLEGVLEENFIDLTHQADLIEGLKTTPAAALRSSRRALDEEDFSRMIEVFKAHDIRYLAYIGGNGTMLAVQKLVCYAQKADFQFHAIGVPKTIDNDLEETDHCPGYGSVARWWANATRDAGLDTESLARFDTVKVIETMGRNTGWIAASTALAKEHESDAPHLIYVPEIPFDEEQFISDVDTTVTKFGRAVIVVGEGLKDKEGNYISASRSSVDVDGHGQPQLGGVAARLCQIVATRLGIKARWDKPGTIQRVSSILASPVDREESFMVGEAAVDYLIAGETNCMVSIVRESNEPYRSSTRVVPLEKVAGRERTLPRHFMNEDANFVSEDFLTYIRPLIGGALPHYTRLRDIKIPKKMHKEEG